MAHAHAQPQLFFSPLTEYLHFSSFSALGPSPDLTRWQKWVASSLIDRYLWIASLNLLPTKAPPRAMLSVFKKRKATAANLSDSSTADSSVESTKRKKMSSEVKPIPGNTQWDLITGTFERDLVNPLNSVRSAHQLYGEIFRFVVA